MADLDPDRQINHTVSHLGGVVNAVHNKGRQIGATAEAILASHRKTGASDIEVEYQDTDVVVSLVDEAAVSIEFGHFADNGEVDASVRYVPGLYVITRAAYGL